MSRQDRVTIEVRQQDWIPGFAAFLPNEKGPQGEAQVVLNVGGLMACVAGADTDPADVPYIVAECLMHEVIHVLEQWAGVAFSEKRVEELLSKYRADASPEWASDEIDEDDICSRLHQVASEEPDELKQATLIAALALLTPDSPSTTQADK